MPPTPPSLEQIQKRFEVFPVARQHYVTLCLLEEYLTHNGHFSDFGDALVLEIQAEGDDDVVERYSTIIEQSEEDDVPIRHALIVIYQALLAKDSSALEIAYDVTSQILDDLAAERGNADDKDTSRVLGLALLSLIADLFKRSTGRLPETYEASFATSHQLFDAICLLALHAAFEDEGNAAKKAFYRAEDDKTQVLPGKFNREDFTSRPASERFMQKFWKESTEIIEQPVTHIYNDIDEDELD
ncbi:MAG: hypothetical protein ACAI35_04785 [Candidatus Methylacidiphilales bacterium]|nr:hypothetical protein [Candidatus Methylacidiphilales bacterium]